MARALRTSDLTDENLSMKGKYPVVETKTSFMSACGILVEAGTRGIIKGARTVKETDVDNKYTIEANVGDRLLVVVFPFNKGMDRLWSDGYLKIMLSTDTKIIGRVSPKHMKAISRW